MASSVIGALRVNLGIDTAQFNDGVKGVRASLDKMGKSMQRVGVGMSAAITLPLLGIGTAAIQAAGESEKATASVRQALESMGEGAGYSLEKLQEMASGLQALSNYDDDDIMSKITANLLTFGNVQGDVFARAQQSALDLSARLGTDLQSSTVMLGKALNDPVKGISALTRVGVAFTEQQKEQIKAMAEAGDVAGAQSMILAELEKQYGGQALAQANTTLGQQAQAWNAIGDAMEAVGAVLLPVVGQIAGYVKSAAEAFSALSPATQEFVVISAGLAAALGPALIALGLMATAMAAISAPVLAVVAAVAAVTAGLYLLNEGVKMAMPFIQQLAGDVWARITAGVESAKQAFIGFKERVVAIGAEIIAAFQAIPGQMMQIGSDIINGLWQGIQSKWDGLKGSVTGLASSIKGWFTGPLQIQSPSKVMADVGVNVMEGLGQGMESMSGHVQSIGESIAQTVASSFQGLIDGSKTVKDVLKDLLSQLSSMLMNQAFKSLTSGILGGSGGGFLSGIGKLFGFARGGTIMPGGAGGIDSQLVAFRKSPNERVDITKPGQSLARGEGQNVHVTVSVDDDGKVQAYVSNMGRQAAQAGAAVAVSQVKQSMPQFIANAQTRSM